ncbi:MAG: phage holin family protein [Alistipes sp.]|nr:phage holin family protein [Alistipes sp.]
MVALFKYVSGCMAALVAMLCPVSPLVTAALLFIAIDFVTGIAASRAVARREGSEWRIESRKAWRTVFKAGFVALAIVMMWVIDSAILDFMHLNLAKLFTGFVCGVELWSFLENAAAISGSPLFELMGRWVKRRMGEEVMDE